MNQSLKNKILSFIKKTLIIATILFIFTFLEIYWAMGSFSERMSSGCLDCSFFDDAYLMSVFSTVFLTIVFLLFTLLKNKYLQIGLEFICLIFVWFLWDYGIFVDRESAWSTYLLNEEIMYTLSFSFFPILVLSTVMLVALHYILRKL
ncbi:hypothetical protein [Flavobacterium sp. KACC 22763]|uniref:hypothetical protein n=1 Tax=Flavobacterium sp. KACC 22763 TaxID=3025668 RepID=UPI0023670CBD|nr:hypothetical protein [Flavobacterium sp. KACC 22763]WDF63146.1 hypothetical protein PQ463_16185 [Flavobacterium sp. KACC 22763]